MKTMFWLAVAGSAAVLVFIARYVMRRISDRERASEARAAEFMAQMAGAKRAVTPTPPAPVLSSPPGPSMETQKLLLDAARKAGEAGEPALALQLYERFLARFPASAFAGEVRVAIEAQKRKLAGTQSPA